MPLFFQGSLGKSATDSGLLSTAMMLGTVFGATIFGQLLSRFGGRYRSLGLIGIIIMAIGLIMLAQINTDVSLGFVITSMVIMSFGMGTTFPCFNIAIQNSVRLKDIGIATSSAQFIRSIGASAGLAVLGSLLTTRFASKLQLNLPEATLKSIPAGLLDNIKTNPDALIDSSQIGDLKAQINPLISNESGLVDTIISAMRQSLAESIAEMFIVVLVIVAIAFIVTFWLKEIPLQKRAEKDKNIQ
jgi:MFS family permease